MSNLSGSFFKYPPQDADEFETLCQYVRDLRPKTIMEIGSRHGRSLIRLAEASMPSLRRVIIVDLPGSLWGKANSEQALSDCAEHLRGRGVEVDLHFIDSHSREAHALSLRERGCVDFLFIDGDHTYEGVMNDYLWFAPCVVSGGVVAFHDVCATPNLAYRGNRVEVPRLWDEIKTPEDVVLHKVGSPYGIGIKTIKY
jgi:predicted O-methyltransferase YrrM